MHHRFTRNNLYKLIILLCIVQFYACSPTKYLNDEQSLLSKNTIIVHSDEINEDEKKKIIKDLGFLYKQRPNSKWFLFFPREYFYLKRSQPQDSSWFDKWVRNEIGEPPAIYENQVSSIAANDMQQYLRNKKGYYHATVEHEFLTLNQRTLVMYHVYPRERYRISSISYYSEDKEILKEIEKLNEGRLIQPNDPLDASVFDREKQRIASALQNRGYSSFIPNYIQIKGDSSVTNKTAEIFFDIKTPLPKLYHQKHVVGDINVFTDYSQGQRVENLSIDSTAQAKYYFIGAKPVVKTSFINKLLSLEKGNLYKKTDQQRTFKKLSGLSPYRFVTLQPYQDSLVDSILHYNILLTPFENRWIANYGLNLFYASVNSDRGRQLIGFGVSSSFTNRNFLRRAYQLSFNVEYSNEFEIRPAIVQSANNINVQSNLSLPKQYDLLGLANFLRSSKLISPQTYQRFKDETRTQFSLGYNIQNINDFYTIRSLNTSFGYDYQPVANKRILLRQIGISSNNYELDSLFEERIKDNQFIIRSFADNLLTGFLFKDLSYLRNSSLNKFGFRHTFIGNFELSGGEIFLVNRLLKKDQEIKRFRNDIEFAQYLKFELDSRWLKELPRGQQFAARLNFGYAVPLINEQEIPYSRQFFVGGPNSMRAWQIRELGPGSHSEVVQDNLPFFQQGDIKLELNAEYRFDMFWLLEGALFVDAGNVWTRKTDSNRLGSKFGSRFYEQMAIGMGWGLRFDFSYFIIRFDFGYKLRNPQIVGEKIWVPLKGQKLGVVQVGVNYPF